MVRKKVLQLRMVDEDAWTGKINVHKLLDRLSEAHYTILTLQHLLLVDGRFSLDTLLQSTTATHLLMISRENN